MPWELRAKKAEKSSANPRFLRRGGLLSSLQSGYVCYIIIYGRKMARGPLLLFLPLIVAGLSGCEVPPLEYPLAASPPSRDRLETPREIVPSRLEYAQEPDSFAPVLTHRVSYPTQDQANYAFERDGMAAVDSAPPDRRAVRVRLFACRPGVLNDTTVRIEPVRGHAVHCATEFFDAQNRRLSRNIVNFYYDRGAWHMLETAPPTTPAPWIDPEPSPTNYFSWAPFGRRTASY